MAISQKVKKLSSVYSKNVKVGEVGILPSLKNRGIFQNSKTWETQHQTPVFITNLLV